MLLMNVSAQVDGDNGPDMPWIIYIETEARWIAAFVDEKEFSRPRIGLELDEPWLPSNERFISIRRYDMTEEGEDAPYRETPTERKVRLDREWPLHGGVQLDTPLGKRWVLSSELDLARRAHEMADATSLTSGDAESGEGLAIQNPARLGFFSAWGVHIVVVLGAAVLIGLIVRFVLIDQFRPI